MLHHPNSHLPEAVFEDGLWTGAGVLRSCGLKVERYSYPEMDNNPLLYGKLGTAKFLVYVRMTWNEEQETGTGPMPGILIDAAAECGAEPHVIRVHMSDVGQGRGFTYFGKEALTAAVKAHEPEWIRSLIGRRSVADFLRLKGGQVSELKLEIKRHSGYKETATMRLLIDGEKPTKRTICPLDLLCSTWQSDELYIFTCSCGESGCAGINRGIKVVHDGPYTLWKAYYARGRKVFVFDREQYKREILTQCAAAIRLVKKDIIDYIVPWEDRLKYLEKAYYEATEPRGDMDGEI